MKVFTIIVTYNGSRWIEKCLSSISASSVPVHIIVIDNASTDNTVELIDKKFPETELIRSKENLGFGRANNIGLKRALEQKADYVFLLNQDAWVNGNTIEGLMRVSENHPEYGILSPFHLNYDGTATERYFDEWVLIHYTPGYKQNETDRDLKEVYSSSFVHAACWLMPISTVKDVGGFDPLFFHYGEDNDYVQRLHFKELKVGIVPRLKVFHEGSHDGLNSPEENISFLTNQSLLQLKAPEASYAGAFVLFVRQYIKAMTGQNEYKKAVYKSNFRKLYLIFKSRFIQKNQLAYLK